MPYLALLRLGRDPKRTSSLDRWSLDWLDFGYRNHMFGLSRDPACQIPTSAVLIPKVDKKKWMFQKTKKIFLSSYNYKNIVVEIVNWGVFVLL